MSAKQKTAVLLVAAGRGSRLGAIQPKQYLDLAGTPILLRSLTPFAQHHAIDLLQVVIAAADKLDYENLVARFPSDLLPPVTGGATRQASVLAGLNALAPHRPDLVLVHDAARPFVSSQIITSVIEGLARAKAVIPTIPVTDTIKLVENSKVEKTLERSKLFAVQTPQGFDFATLMKAHDQASPDDVFTDDAAIAEHFGIEVLCVEGDSNNIKITSLEDFESAQAQLTTGRSKMQTHIGQGFDVHRFGPGNHVILCGIEIPHDHGLIGHSDADAGMHALTDALLGAIGQGDIGTHFPPSDDSWKDMASDIFLTKSRDLIAAQSGTIINVDITIICEIPKIEPHREAMATRIADILTIDKSRVSIKATTSEGLGFTGRREGIAAQAIASVLLPDMPSNQE